MTTNSFGARATMSIGDRSYDIYRLDRLGAEVAPLPYLPAVLRSLAAPAGR
jgi:hypothetical protein